MDNDIGYDRKRKASQDDDGFSKRQVLENNVSHGQSNEQDFIKFEDFNEESNGAESLQQQHQSQDKQDQEEKPESQYLESQVKTETDESTVEPVSVKTDADVVTKTESTISTNIPFDRLILLHLEATCDENPTNPAAVQVTKEKSEIIELTFVDVDASNLEVLHKQQIYVKPERTPFTHFCSEVTGIKWPMLENAGTLDDAIKQLEDYITREIENKNKSFCFATHGGWALRIQLPREARDKNLTLPNFLAYCRMFDLKQEIQLWQVHHPEVSLRSTSVRDLCDTFNITRVRDQTVGLNNALTTLEIIKYLLTFQHKDVFVHPIDTMADLRQFKKEQSQVIHLAGLPYEVTQGELEAWFSSNGLRPTTMWMIQPSDNSKPSISGFVVFQQHDDANRALLLNGRCLGDRPIEVCPSSSRVIDAAGNMLVPFPLQAKSKHLRPGDWNCSNCGFHNFASRLYCFKCNTDNPNPAPNAGTGPPPQPVYQGDWMCPNCHFHNYSSRMQCKKCAAPKPKTFKGGSNKKLVNAPPTGSMHDSRPPPQQQPYQSNPYNAGAPSTVPTGPSGGGYHGGYNSGGRPHHHTSFRPGDWYCPNKACGFQNFASRSACFRCHTPNPNQGQPPSTQHAQYSPHQPGYGYSAESTNSSYSANTGYAGSGGGVNNSGGSGGYGYGQSGSGYSGQSGYGASGGGYASGGNGGGYSYGGQGGGGGYGGGASVGGTMPYNTQFRAGDWICPSCNSHNFASRYQCLKCSTAKPYTPSGSHAGGYGSGAAPNKRYY